MAVERIIPIIEEQVEPYVLTVDEKKALTDVWVHCNSLEEYYHKTVLAGCHYDRNAITKSYHKKVDINKYILELMRGQVLINEAEYDYEDLDQFGNPKCIKEAVYNTPPTLVTELREQVRAKFPDCSVTALDYNVDTVVKWSDGTGTLTFTNFKKLF